MDVMKLVDTWLSHKGLQDLSATVFRGCSCCFVAVSCPAATEEAAPAAASHLPATHQAMDAAAKAEAGLTSVLLSRLVLEVSPRAEQTLGPKELHHVHCGTEDSANVRAVTSADDHCHLTGDD